MGEEKILKDLTKKYAELAKCIRSKDKRSSSLLKGSSKRIALLDKLRVLEVSYLKCLKNKVKRGQKGGGEDEDKIGNVEDYFIKNPSLLNSYEDLVLRDFHSPSITYKKLIKEIIENKDLDFDINPIYKHIEFYIIFNLTDNKLYWGYTSIYDNTNPSIPIPIPSPPIKLLEIGEQLTQKQVNNLKKLLNSLYTEITSGNTNNNTIDITEDRYDTNKQEDGLQYELEKTAINELNATELTETTEPYVNDKHKHALALCTKALVKTLDFKEKTTKFIGDKTGIDADEALATAYNKGLDFKEKTTKFIGDKTGIDADEALATAYNKGLDFKEKVKSQVLPTLSKIKDTANEGTTNVYRTGKEFFNNLRAPNNQQASSQASAQEPTVGGKKTTYRLNGEKVLLLHKNKKVQRSIYVKDKGKTKYCKIDKEYVLLSKVKNKIQ